MKETIIKSYHYAVLEKVTNIRTAEGDEGLYRTGDKEIVLVEFLDEGEKAEYFEKLKETIDPETEAVRILSDEDTAFNVQKVIDELDYMKRRAKNVPIPSAEK